MNDDDEDMIQALRDFEADELQRQRWAEASLKLGVEQRHISHQYRHLCPIFFKGGTLSTTRSA